MREAVWADDGSDLSVAGHLARLVGRGGASIAVPGGKTPEPILRDLAARQDLPWADTRVTLVDDRIVPAGHACSNHGLLLRTLGPAGARIVPLSIAARPEHLDLVWLGMGGDGHIASVFPNTIEAFSERPEIVRTRPDPMPAEAPFERLTMTLGALSDCDEMILVIRGMQKRMVLEQAMAGANDLPIARLLRLYSGPLTIYWSEA